MTRTISTRLSRLEATRPAGSWREWEGRPADDWSDEALESFLRASISKSGGHPPATFTDEQLAAIAAESEASPTASVEHPSA